MLYIAASNFPPPCAKSLSLY